MTELIKDVAYCGLYCVNCSKFNKQKCPGCAKNEKATWCKIRSCCLENAYASCADCKEYEYVKDCEKYNNVFARVIEFVTRTDRSLCIEQIKNDGVEFFVDTMTKNGKMSLPRESKSLL